MPSPALAPSVRAHFFIFLYRCTFDLYLVSFGYCVVRRYFRHPDRKLDPSPLLLCESQNILLNSL